MGQPAKVLESADVCRLLSHVRVQRNPARNRVTILLSFKAGLRAAEIAGLDWHMVLRPDGNLSPHIQVSDQIAKNRSGRRLPMHPELRSALLALHHANGRPIAGPVVRSERGGHMTPRSIVNWFHQLYEKTNLAGCSSHSGRRTFITRSARLLAKAGGSLRDVQELAGHRSLVTTERYIEGDRDAQRRLIRLL
ncbi:site-specific integrase [Sandarakinorhabdus sp.]|uniref:tyrosine-type recombinase/integrase n=1 Tax=Sandarakinorhabdus sp. TaxID=1916663 RepID=UPI00286EA3DA|nr:site-specific integrase [Sandarakinorhabdus sp.]